MANYYKKDPKTGKWVVDEEMQKTAQRSAAKKPSAGTGGKGVSSDSSDPVGDAIADWESHIPQFNADLAARDAYNVNLAANKSASFIDANKYKVGGAQKINTQQGLYGIKQAGMQLPGLQEALQGATPTGMTEEENKELQAYLGEVDKFITAQELMASARTGDTSWQNDDSLTKSQKAELGRMNSLYERDKINAATKDVTRSDFDSDPEWNRFLAGMMAGDEIAIQQAVDKSRLKTNMTVPEYSANMKGVSEVAENEAARQKGFNEWQTATNEASQSLRKNEDFAQKSQYVPDSKYGQDSFYDNWRMQGHINPDGSVFDTATEKEYAINALLNDWVAAGQDEEAISKLEEKANAIGADMNRYNIEAIPYMSAEQQEDFFYHFNNGDIEGAKKLLEDLDYGLQKQRWEAETKESQEWYDQAAWWEKAGASLASVPVNFVNQIVGGSQMLAGLINPDGLNEVHEYSPVYDYGRIVQQTRGNVGNEITEAAPWANIPGTDMNILNMGYQGGMSALDSLLNAWAFGGAGAWAPAAAMGGSAFANSRREALADGKGNFDAYIDALASMAIEAGTEYIPFDIIGKDAIKPLAKAGFGMLAEGLGEGTSELLNIGYDAARYGNQSDVGQYYNTLLTQGYTQKDAVLQTVKKYGLQVLESGLTGMISGAGSAGSVAVGESIENSTHGKNIIGNEGVADLVKVAESVGLDGSNAKILADIKAALGVDEANSEITDEQIMEEAAEPIGNENVASETTNAAPVQIDTQSVIDRAMEAVSGRVNSDVSAAVESAVNEAAEFLADDAADNGGVNTEGAINNAVIVAQEALGEVDGADAEVVKNAITEAVKGSMRPQENAQGVQETAEGIAKDNGKSEGIELDSAEAMKFDPEAAKKAAAKQALDEIDSMEGVENMSEEQRFETLITRTAEIFEQMKAEAEQAVQKSEQNTNKQTERSENSASDIEAEAADAVQEDEQNARDKQERADQQRNADVGSVVPPEQAKTARDKGERSSKGKRSKGGKISPAKVGQLYRASMAKLDAQAQEVMSTAYARTLEGQLSEKGITGDAAKTISKQLADVIGGRKSTPYITNLINNNSAVRQIYLDSMAKVNTTELDKANLEYMASGIRSKASPAAVKPENLTVDEIEIDAAEGDAPADIVTKNAQKYLGAQAVTMENMYNDTQDAVKYSEAFVRAVNYGRDGRNLDIVKGEGRLSTLNEAQIEAAYAIGRDMRVNAPTAARMNSKGISVGNVDLSEINLGTLDKHQKASVHAAIKLAKAIGFNLKFVESKANALGQYTTENGSWTPETMTLTLDIHAGSNDVGDHSYAMMHTMGHELTHYIKQFADGGMWNEYQAFVMDHLSTKMNNDMLDDKIAKLIAKAKEDGRTLTRDGAIEEIIADASVEALMNITDADIQQIAETNPSLLKKIGEFIQKWVKDIKAAIKAAYSGTESKTALARAMEDQLDEMSARWNKLLVNAAQNRAAEAKGEAINNVGIEISESGDTAYVANPELMYSLRSFNNSDYVTERDKAAAALAKKMGVSIEKAEAYIDDVTSIAAIVAKDRDRLDFEAEDEYSAMKHNSEYKYTMDFSTLCKKRLLYTGTFDAIQKQMSDTALTEDDYIRLRQMMAERGYEVACAFCYVESRRKNNGEIINKFLDVYKEAQKNGTDMELGAKNRRKAFKPEAGFTPKIADFNTSEGIANIMHNHRGVYDAYMYFMNARGVSKPKLIESRTDYRSEILNKFRSASAVRAMNRRGGLRLQSFSDFEVVNMLDMMQVVMDMSRVGLMSQAYTKVPAFARVFGGTGVKINLSLVTKGVDANGKLIFDDVEGMPHEEAFKIRDMYSEHVGTILVGKDDATIRAAMADPRIDFIIPYHASGWSAENQNALGIGGYTNFTAGQNETNAATGKGVKNFQPSEYWDYSKTGDENAQIYLEKCREAGRVPKFPQYQNYPGYWKMLIDFKMYDNSGVGSPQRAVRPDFNLGEARNIMDNYSGGHQNLPVARDVVNDFVKEYQEKNAPGKKLQARMDAEYQEAYEAGDEYRAREIIREAAIAAGYNPLKLYHGTTSFGFTKIDPQKADDGISFFTSTDDMVAETYVGDGARIRRVGSTNGITIDKLLTADGETLLPLLKKHVNEAYELASREEIRELVNDEGELIRRRVIPRLQEMQKDHPFLFENEDAAKAFDLVINALDRLSYAKNYDLLERLYIAYDDALRDLKKANSEAYTAFIYAGGDEVYSRYYQMQMFLNGDVFKVDGEWDTEYTFRTQAIDELFPKLFKGIYELYGRTDNLLDVNAYGGKWNRLDGSIIGHKGYVSTRDVSAYAKENGYDGVYFHDIVDVGGMSNYNGASDVLTFFNPEDIKSADPFTYDDDGNLISPSQRFDSSKNDIRYQARDNYSTKGMAWAIEEDLLTKVDQRIIHKTLADKDFLKYNVAKTKDGKFVIPCDTVIVFGSGTYKNPVIEDVVIFNVPPRDYERAIKNAMEVLYGDERSYLGRISKYEAHAALEALLQKGSATVFSGPVREAGSSNGYGRRGKGNIGRGIAERSGSGYSEESVTDKKFQQRDLSELSDRELLVQALEGELSPEERDHLQRYKDRVDDIAKKQMQLEAINSEIVELRRNGATAQNSDELRKKMTNAKTLRASIDRVDAKLAQIESARMIQEVVKRNRAEASRKAYALARERADERQRKAVEHAREVGQRKVDRMKESQGKEKYKAQIMKDVKKLHTWLTTPSMKGSVPQFLRKPVADFLESIDFTSDRALKGGEATKNDQKFADALDALRRAVGEINKQQGDIEAGAADFAGYIDLPADYMAEFDDLVGRIKTTLSMGYATVAPFNRMTADQLHELSKMFRVLNSSISKANRLIANGRYESAKAASNDTIDDMNSMKAKVKTNKALELLNSTFNWKNTTPYYAFQRLGRGGKAIFEGLQDGWDKMARNSAKLIEFAKNTFTGKESKAWGSDVSEIRLDSGETIQMTTAQKMSLYCHTKRAQSMGHLLGGGIRISDIDTKRGGTISQVDNYVITEADIARITGSLTARQKAVADALQKFMNTVCKDWGNEISMKRFGYEQMTEDNYFPIETDANNRARIDDTKDGKNSMFRLLNMSSLKPLTPKANNAIIIRNIFDVFSNHAADMAKYNALALPILDYIKWYNYVERTDVVDASGNATGQIKTRSTQKALERAFGVNAKDYLNAFIKDLNAEHDGGRNDGLINKMIGRAKSAAVGANLRVFFLQITSLPRAAYAINPKYLAKGLLKLKSLNPANAIKGTEAQEEIGILQWKDLGFYSTDISNSVRDMVKRDGAWIDKARDAQMAPAGWGDNWVGNIIYEAAKAEMADKHPNVQPGTNAYKTLLNRRVREIVYKTQVVDSTMTRSDFMRSKGLASMLTAFMSEPTLTVNMLNESIQEAVAMHRGGASTRDILRANSGKVVRAASTFAVTAFLTAALEAAFDAMRDDDDYEEFFEKYRAAFGGNVLDNVNVFAMLPYLKDIISIFQGFENSSMITQGWQQLQDFKTAIEAWQEGKRPIYSVVYNGAKAASSLTGFAAGNALRDFASIYNTVLADAWGTPKLQTYADSKSAAANAYYAALQSGDANKLAWIQERAEVNGIAMEDISEKIGTLVKNDYEAGNITEEEAVDRLVEFSGKDADDAYWKVQEWSAGEDNYSKYSNLRSALSSGDSGAANAAYRELVEHGVDEKTISSELTKLYNSGEATSILNLQMRGERLYTSNLKLKTDGEKHPDDFDSFVDAIVNGSGVSSEIRALLDKGYTVKQCMSAINGAFGNSSDRYRIMEKYNSADARILLNRILDAYEALGLDRGEEMAWIDANWIM